MTVFTHRSVWPEFPFSPGHQKISPSRGFTLIELLVVIGIIGILLAICIPAVLSARELVRGMQCSNNMRQIGLGILGYENIFKRLPPSHTKVPAHNVLTFILPFIDQQAAHQRFDMTVNWNKTPNTEARKVEVPIFRCPSAVTLDRKYISDYAANVKIQPAVYNPMIQSGIATKRNLWYNMLRPDQRPVLISEVTDGMSNSFLFFEDSGRPFGFEGRTPTGQDKITGSMWADVDAFYYTHSTCGNNRMINCNNLNETYSFHPGGCYFLYGDDTVRFHPENMNPEVFFSLFTYNQRGVVFVEQ